MTKKHVVLNDPLIHEGLETQTLCAREGRMHFESIYPGHWVLITKAGTHLHVATGARFEDKTFCNSCRHIWKNITRG